MSHRFLHGCVYPRTDDDTNYPITVPDWKKNLRLVNLFLTAEHMDGKLPSVISQNPINALDHTATQVLKEKRAVGVVVGQEIRDDGSVWITARMDANSPDYQWLQTTSPLYLSLSHVQDGAIRATQAKAVEIGVTRDPARNVPPVNFYENMSSKRPAEDQEGGDAKRQKTGDTAASQDAEIRTFIRRSNLPKGIKDALESYTGELTVQELVGAVADGHASLLEQFNQMEKQLSEQMRETTIRQIIEDMGKLAPDLPITQEDMATYGAEYGNDALQNASRFVSVCASRKTAQSEANASRPLPPALPSAAPAATPTSLEASANTLAQLFAKRY